MYLLNDMVNSKIQRLIHNSLSAVAVIFSVAAEPKSRSFIYFSKMNKNISILFIIFFNLIPILGVASFNWQPFEAFWFFWVETLIMALFNTIRIVYSQGQLPDDVNTNKPLVYHLDKGIKYLGIRIAIFLFYAIFIITFIGFVANVNKDKVAVVTTLLLQNKLFNAGLLISIFSQGYYLLMGFFRNGAFYTSTPDSFAAIFDGRQLVIHVAIVLGAFGAMFLEKNTSFGNYANIFIISLLCICKCIFDILNNTTADNTG
jgi:Family of unknown function (DUF6498)